MLFSSLIFIYAFLPLVCILYFIPWPLKIKNLILSVSSIFFYAFGEPRFVLVMLLSILVNFFLGLLVDRARGGRQARLWLICAVVFNIGLLFVYKYLGFSSYLLSQWLPVPLIRIVLPIGISFFTFQALSYVIDVYRGDAKVQKNPLDLALFIAFFPQLIAGPIVRYYTIDAAIRCRSHSLADAAEGFERFLVGLFKKVLLANNLALIADEAFAHTPQISMAMAWLGLLAYAMQIFFDFAGYSDMAIGLARIFGFHLEENFNYPYISRSVSEFWRRWHISLGIWFRDYVYFPLGGSRDGLKRTIRNLLIVWVLTGIWHGANTTFAVWGLYYFVLIALEKLTGWPKGLKTAFVKTVYQVFAIGMVLLGWVIFRADSLTHVAQYFGALFRFDAVFGQRELALLDSYKLFLAAGLLFCTPVAARINIRLQGTRLYPAQLILRTAAYLGLFVAVTAALVVGSHNPFIYFQF